MSSDKSELAESESSNGNVEKASPPKESSPPKQPPDGGLAAWAAVFGAFLMFVMTWGPSIAYGLFQSYYEAQLLSHDSSSKISWIGTLNAFFLIVSGVVAGPLFDRGYLRHLMVLGCVMAVFGMMMLSLASEYYQAILAQGVCFGIGSGLIYVPALAFVNTHFTSKRAVAMGCVTCGASVGGMVFPIIFLHLQPQIGFPWTVRVFGFIMLACSLIALPLLFIGSSPKPTKPRSLIDWPALKDPVFLADGAANFLVFMAYFIPFFYVPSFATSRLESSVSTAFYQLAALNAGSIVARLTTPWTAAKLGSANLLTISVVSSMILLFGWLGVKSNAGFWVWCVIFGFFSGILISSNPVVMAHPVISPTPAVIGTRMGMQWVFTAVGVLIGAPIAGTLLADAHDRDSTNKAFLKLQGFNAAVMAGGLLFLMVPVTAIWRYKPPK